MTRRPYSPTLKAVVADALRAAEAFANAQREAEAERLRLFLLYVPPAGNA